MIALVVLLCEAGLGTATLDRAAYLLGPESMVIDGHNYRYLVSPRLPFTLIFTEDRRLHSFSVRGSIFDARAATALRTKLKGKWFALPIELQPTDAELSWLSRPFTLTLSQDVATINYGIIQQQFFYRSTALGSVLKIGITFPAEQDRLAFVNGRDNDHGLRSLYFINLGPVALCWRPTSAAHFGRLSFCIRLTVNADREVQRSPIEKCGAR